MRITLHIDDGLFADLMRLTQATTKTQAVRDALKEYIRLRRKEELLALRGRLEIEDNWRQLRESGLETPTGIEPTPSNPDFAAQIEVAERVMREDRDVLRKLAE